MNIFIIALIALFTAFNVYAEDSGFIIEEDTEVKNLEFPDEEVVPVIIGVGGAVYGGAVGYSIAASSAAAVAGMAAAGVTGYTAIPVVGTVVTGVVIGGLIGYGTAKATDAVIKHTVAKYRNGDFKRMKENAKNTVKNTYAGIKHGFSTVKEKSKEAAVSLIDKLPDVEVTIEKVPNGTNV